MEGNISAGKFTNSVEKRTADAFTKNGTKLVPDVEPNYPQQTEVASPEASQGMASIILGSVWYQQAQRKETTGEGSDTSETIEAETSSNQEVINETGVEENNSDFTLQTFDDDVYVSPPPLEDDIPSHTSLPSPLEENNSDFTLQTFDDDVYVSPAPLENDIPSHTSLPSPFEKVVFPPPPLPQVDDIPEPPPSLVDDAFQNIIQEANPDTKKSRLEQFFTPNDDKETTLKKANLILKDLKNSAPNKIIKDALEAFLKNPSNDKDVFKVQYDLAEQALKNQTLNKNDEILKNLFSPSDDDITRETQYCVLKNKLDSLKSFTENSSPIPDPIKNSLKVALDVFLQTPSEDNDTFKAQCDLAKTAVANGILKAEEQTDKEIITKFLQTPSDYPGTFKAQCNLAEAIKADDAIILQNLFSPSNDDWIRYTQQFFMSDMLNNKINADSDDSQKAFAKAALLNFLAEDDDNMNDDLLIKQYDFTQTAVTKGILKAEDKEIITKLLKKPSDDQNILRAQYDLAKTAVANGILKAEDKEIITKFLQTPSDYPGTFKAQYDLAEIAFKNEILNEDDKILKNLFSPSDYTRNTQYLVIKDCTRSSSDNSTFIKVAIKAFLKNPSNDENVLKQQYNLAKAAIKNGFMEPEECEKISDKIKNLILEQKITVAKNLPYLTNDQLKSIDEAMLLQDSENENKQFKLEYFLDLKISRGLYNDNWEDLANVIKDNAKILTPEDNRDIYDDGVYNLTVIALKQMPLDKRNEFLRSICPPKETKKTPLQGLLTNDNKCDNEKLLTIRPVLKQYKNKDVNLDFSNLSHDYRMPRTTDRCEIFKEGDQNYLGYQGTNQRIKTDLSQEQIEYLFGEQRPNGNQQEVGICWLISELKEFNYDPELKLFIMSRFSMDKNGDVSITLKNGNKVTFPKDIVEKATTTVNEEHISPAMACLSLLAALNRTRENTKADISADTYGIFNQNIIANEDYLKEQLKKENTYAFRGTSNKSLKPLTDSQDPISYALREYNYAGNQYDDLLSLFFDKAQNPDLNKENFIIKSDLNTYHHAWSHYNDKLAANPQNSNTLFIKKGEVLSTYPSDASRQDVFGIEKHYYVPKIDINKYEFYS